MSGNKRKVVLVGTGMVGMSFAYAALNQNVCDELIMIDLNEKRAEGEAMDLNHGLAFSHSSMKIRCGGYGECADADIVVKTQLYFLQLCQRLCKAVLREFSLLRQIPLTL